jgi:hypothetical protein
MRATALFLAITLTLTPAIADDGAAAIAAGGLVMRREPRITMAKEVLTISTRKLTVVYDFRNDTDADITTEVAFPIPPYSYFGNGERESTDLGFDDFRLWIDGKPQTYSVQTRAFVGKSDVTETVQANRLDVASFGGASVSSRPGQIDRLTDSAKKTLANERILTRLQDDGYYANWSIHKRYFWSQTFPAHRTIHIRHEYSPETGSALVFPSELTAISEIKEPDPELREESQSRRRLFFSFCPSQRNTHSLSKKQGMVALSWVDFILTTANTWKRPIEDFTLIVERPDRKSTVSFCWDGPVEQIDANHFQAQATNFIPTKELHIGFYQLLPPEKP